MLKQSSGVKLALVVERLVLMVNRGMLVLIDDAVAMVLLLDTRAEL